MTQSFKVLLIEDDIDYAALVVRYLEPHTVVHRTNIREGLAYFQAKQSCDVVLLDLGLPDSYGLDSLVKLVELDERVPVVVLTGVSDDGELWLRAMTSGAVGWLEKNRISGDYVIESKIRDAIITKQVSNELADQREKAIAERERWQKFFDELWFFLTGLLAVGRDIGEQPNRFRQVMRTLEAAKLVADEETEAELTRIFADSDD